MGTQAGVHLRGRPHSQVSALRHGELARDDRHPWLTEVLALCDQPRDRTDGYFDAWLPGGFDPRPGSRIPPQRTP